MNTKRNGSADKRRHAGAQGAPKALGHAGREVPEILDGLKYLRLANQVRVSGEIKRKEKGARVRVILAEYCR